MPLKVTNISYKLVILMCYFVSSWSILRQVPSRYEMSQQQQRSGDPSVTSTSGSSSSSSSTAVTSRRARNQYAASLNATVSLGEMLGNPLEISNDLLVQQTTRRRSHHNSNSAAAIEDNNNSVDVYHAATTFAQLHRVSNY